MKCHAIQLNSLIFLTTPWFIFSNVQMKWSLRENMSPCTGRKSFPSIVTNAIIYSQWTCPFQYSIQLHSPLMNQSCCDVINGALTSTEIVNQRHLLYARFVLLCGHIIICRAYLIKGQITYGSIELRKSDLLAFFVGFTRYRWSIFTRPSC